MYASDPIRGWAQTFSGGSEETQPNNEGSGKKRVIEVVRLLGKLNTGCPKKRRDHNDKD